jgi:hypothetical protein
MRGWLADISRWVVSVIIREAGKLIALCSLVATDSDESLQLASIHFRSDRSVHE